MKAFIAPDVHGNLDLLAGLLQQEGIIDEGGERIDRDTFVIQLGDLCNCVGSSIVDDSRCLDHVEKWFDVYLVGNHEHPYFGGPAFRGFWRDSVLGQRLRTLSDSGFLQPCVAVDGVLVSHAGLTPDMAGPEGEHAGWTTAEAADEEIRWARRTDPTYPIFSAIGAARNGSHPHGGILWSDWDEPKTTEFRQVVGHTPDASARYLEGPGGWLAVCIDVGGKHGERLVGAWLRDGELEVVAARRDAGVTT